MKHDVIERLDSFLREEGFTNVTIQRASHDVTLAASKGDTRLVAHLSDRVAVPARAQAHDRVPDPSAIAVLPLVPGLPVATAPGTRGTGGGSGAAKAASPR